MRTTLNIDRDVLHAVKERARREGRTAGEVLSDVARRGLTQSGQVGEIAESGAFYGFQPLPSRGTVVSNDLIDQLREDDPV